MTADIRTDRTPFPDSLRGYFEFVNESVAAMFDLIADVGDVTANGFAEAECPGLVDFQGFGKVEVRFCGPVAQGQYAGGGDCEHSNRELFNDHREMLLGFLSAGPESVVMNCDSDHFGDGLEHFEIVLCKLGAVEAVGNVDNSDNGL